MGSAAIAAAINAAAVPTTRDPTDAARGLRAEVDPTQVRLPTRDVHYPRT
ncbi:hypothetical protein LTT66_12660 [Nocardia gipuzkoensis]|nr:MULTISPECIES: hypothetical protein [Nocardia]UGT70936.1 hypothetical protein LTT66_12660 [Nocardia gipuzkoensis]